MIFIPRCPVKLSVIVSCGRADVVRIIERSVDRLDQDMILFESLIRDTVGDSAVISHQMMHMVVVDDAGPGPVGAQLR